jgi:ABC-type amino acid transport system permease subunit
MPEKINGIRNPLTIIAIFAGLAEVAGTVAMATVNKELQGTFVWFVMGFPILLVLLFFLTWNFNPKVLYAPSDFRSDDSFLEMNRSGKIIASSFRSAFEELQTEATGSDTAAAANAIQSIKNVLQAIGYYHGEAITSAQVIQMFKKAMSDAAPLADPSGAKFKALTAAMATANLN